MLFVRRKTSLPKTLVSSPYLLGKECILRALGRKVCHPGHQQGKSCSEDKIFHKDFYKL